MMTLEAREIRYRQWSNLDTTPFSLHIPALAFPRGSVIALTGPNGSGKSTLLQHIAGRTGQSFVQEASAAWWHTDGVKLPAADVHAFLAAKPRFFPGMLPKPYLRLTRYTRHTGPTDQEIEETLERFGLSRRLGRVPAETYSSGQQKRLGLARIFLQETPLILLDEPNANLDGDSQHLIGLVIEKSRLANGIAFMVIHDRRFLSLASHHLRICPQRGLVVESGEIL